MHSKMFVLIFSRGFIQNLLSCCQIIINLINFVREISVLFGLYLLEMPPYKLSHSHFQSLLFLICL